MATCFQLIRRSTNPRNLNQTTGTPSMITQVILLLPTALTALLTEETIRTTPRSRRMITNPIRVTPNPMIATVIGTTSARTTKATADPMIATADPTITAIDWRRPLLPQACVATASFLKTY
jgi:hypothetical protein